MEWQNWTLDELPPPLPPTGSLDEAKRRMDHYGYVILERHLAGDEVERIRKRLTDQAAAELAIGRAFLHDPNHTEHLNNGRDYASTDEDTHFGREQFVLTLFNKGQEFWTPLLHEKIQSLVTHVLGSEFRLFTFTGSLLHPGAPLMGLHTDQWFMNQPVRRSDPGGEKSGDVTRIKAKPELSNDPLERINPSYTVQTIWMLTDFTEENGATRLVPKSHLSGVVPEATTPHPYRSIPATGPAGSVLLYDGRLWHSAGAHKGEAIRYALHGFFSAPQIRSQENYSLSLLPDIRRQLPQRLLELCGFKTWWSIGVVDDFRQEMVDPDQNKLGRLELAATEGSAHGS